MRSKIIILGVFIAMVSGCGSSPSPPRDNVARASVSKDNTSSSPAAVSPKTFVPEMKTSKTEDIKHFISVSGGNVLGREMLKGLLGFYFMNMRKSFPGVSEDVFRDIRKIMEEEANIDELILMFVPIYDKYYTQDEIREMTMFFESPVGKKMTVNSRSVVMESMEMSKIWGRELREKAMPRIKERLRAEGITSGVPDMDR